MYHIKADKRVQNSAELIGEALLRLLREKEFNQITITDIQRASTVGRATFYRLFDNTADVLAYLCDQTTERILAKQRGLTGQNTRQIILFFITEWMQSETLLQAIFDSDHVDVLYHSMQHLAEEGGPSFFPGERISQQQLDYIVSIASTALIGGLSAWVRHGKTESPEDVYALLEGAVSAFYRVIHRI